jgi:hypothetical protein
MVNAFSLRGRRIDRACLGLFGEVRVASQAGARAIRDAG